MSIKSVKREKKAASGYGGTGTPEDVIINWYNLLIL